MTPVAVEIQDTGRGKKSVADDLEAVLRKIEHWHQGSIAHYRIKLPEHSRDRAPGRMGRENGASALSSDPTRALAYTIAKRKGHAASADTWMKQGVASNFAFIEPMNALRVRDLPVGDWLYEVKFDGYRALALKAGKEVRFVSRSTGLNNDYPQLILECQARQLRFGALARARLVYRHRSASLSALVPALCGRS